MQQPVVEAIGDDLDATIASLHTWSSACIAAGYYPPDVYKRAAS